MNLFYWLKEKKTVPYIFPLQKFKANHFSHSQGVPWCQMIRYMLMKVCRHNRRKEKERKKEDKWDEKLYDALQKNIGTFLMLTFRMPKNIFFYVDA